MNELSELAIKYGTDKCIGVGKQGHFYTDFYYEEFKDRKYSIKKVLEIGVGNKECMAHCPNYIEGASLFMWRDFFPNSQIYAIDILPDLVFKKDRVETFLYDQFDREDLLELISRIGTDIDLVVDDGSHIPEHQVFTCKTLMPILNKSVEYIIEDVSDPTIVEQLKDYDCHLVRKSRAHNRYNRLLVVKNKING